MILALTLFNDLGCLDSGDGQKCTRERALPIRQKNCLSTLSFLLMSISMKCIPVQMVDGIVQRISGRYCFRFIIFFLAFGFRVAKHAYFLDQVTSTIPSCPFP